MARQKVKGISISSTNATGTANATSGYVLKADGSGGASWASDSVAAGIVSSADATAITISSGEVVTFTNETITDGNGSTGGVTVSDGLVKINTGTGSVAAVDFYCEVNNAHRVKLKAPAHSDFSGNVDVTLPNYTSTLIGTNSSGNVGIGETTPLAKLHIKRGDSGLSSLNAAGDHIFLENTGSNGTGITLASGNTANGSIIFGDQDSNYRGVLIYDHSADAMKFVTAAAERTRIQATGKTAWSANGIGDVTSVPRDFAFYTEGATNGVEVRSNDERLVFMGAGGSSGTAVDAGYVAIANGGTTKIALNANGTSDIGGGAVNMSSQPMFGAARNAGYLTDDQVWISDHVDTNVGSHYNSSNGKFTAPVAGVYFFTGSVMTHDSGSNANQVSWSFRKNNSDIKEFRQHKTGAYHTRVDGSMIITLAENDYVTLFVDNSGTSSGWAGSQHIHNHFGGFLIG